MRYKTDNKKPLTLQFWGGLIFVTLLIMLIVLAFKIDKLTVPVERYEGIKTGDTNEIG